MNENQGNFKEHSAELILKNYLHGELPRVPGT